MNNNEWITDRLPTLNDTHGTCDCVWVTWSHGDCGPRTWFNVEKDQPWQPLTKPAPYVKPKRWSVTLNSGEWCLVDAEKPNDTHYLPKIGHHCPAVQRICDIYNEVMP
jgi:hypothetical protein